MNRNTRHPRAVNALLTLALFLSWWGGAFFHNHGPAFHNHGPTSSPCKVCQSLQSNLADLPAECGTTRPTPHSERIVGAAPIRLVAALLLVPEGRAPPSA